MLAGAVFLGCLGSVDFWGKREQRASAEAIDTVDHHHWLVAQIQGRPRLEKPPLPRWSIAALMVLTGRRDEWIVRLPGALPALATVALSILGRRMGGRPLGLASALVLCSLGVLRRRDAPGGQRRAARAVHHAGAVARPGAGSTTKTTPCGQPPPASHGARASRNLVLYARWGSGFDQGPGHPDADGRDGHPLPGHFRPAGLGPRRLADVRGLLLFAALALSWPTAVLLRRPERPAGLVD